YTVQVEVGELPVEITPEQNTSIGSKGEQIHQLGIVSATDCEGKGLLGNDSINHRWAKLTPDTPLYSRVNVTMKYSGNVIAVVNPDKLTTQGITVAMLY